MPAYLVQMQKDVKNHVAGVNGAVVFAADAAEAREVAQKAIHPNDWAGDWTLASVTEIAAGTYDFSEFVVTLLDPPNQEVYTYVAAVGDTVDNIGDGIAAVINAGARAGITYTGATQVVLIPLAENLGDKTITAKWHKFHGVRQVETITMPAAMFAGDTMNVTVDGVKLTEVFATNSNTTIAAMATQIQGEAGVVTATVTDEGGGTDDDRSIVITSLTPGAPSKVQDISITSASARASMTKSITTPDGAPVEDTDYTAMQPTVEAEGAEASDRDITLAADAIAVPALLGRVRIK